MYLFFVCVPLLCLVGLGWGGGGGEGFMGSLEKLVCC